mgnify:CR=1 FL=1
MITVGTLAGCPCKKHFLTGAKAFTSTPYLDLTTYVASFFNLTGFELEGPPAFEEELEETPEEASRYTEPQAENLLTALIWREIRKAVKA